MRSGAIEVCFKNRALQKCCNSQARLIGKHGQDLAELIMLRLSQIAAAGSMADLRQLPGLRLHQLQGSRRGQYSVTVRGRQRLIFVPDHDPLPKRDDGGLAWERIHRILILALEDYH